MAGNVSYGTTFTFETVVIDDVKSIRFSGVSRSMSMRTPLAATHARKLPGRPDAGTVTIELYYNETVHNTFWATLSAAYSSTSAPAPSACIITYPDGTTLTFSAFVKGLAGPEADGEGLLVSTLTLAITGPITKS